MKNMLFFLCPTLFLLACGSGDTVPDPGTPNAAKSDTTTAPPVTFFPVTAYLQGQVTILDSLPVTILQVTTSKGRTDSVWLPKEKLRSALSPFFEDKIDKQNLVTLFKESKFKDESTAAITFTYEPLPNQLPDSIRLRHWDVYVDPETGQIKRVYIVKQILEQGLNITRQLTWVAAKNARVVDISNDPNSPGKVNNETRWIWNFNEE